ncbi:unnamed protein product, partial [marine sediment metagenome]
MKEARHLIPNERKPEIAKKELAQQKIKEAKRIKELKESLKTASEEDKKHI